MLATQQPISRKFWHAVMPLSDLKTGPQPFTLLGEDIVFWMRKTNRRRSKTAVATVRPS